MAVVPERGKADYTNLAFEFEPNEKDDISTSFANQTDRSCADDITGLFETETERRARKLSHYVIYLTIFVLAIGFSVVITGVFPYLKLLEKDSQLSKTKLGWVIAANPFGQMIVAPLLGYVGNKLGSIRIICYLTILLYCIGNIIYGCLPRFVGLWEHSAFHFMLLSRLITGLSSANLTLCRSYLAASTTIKERTCVMSSLSAAVSLGYIIGPVLQLALSLLIADEEVQYQASGYIPAILGLFNFILLTPWIFKEYDIAKKERQLLRQLRPNAKKILPKADKIGLLSLLFCVFVLQYNYVLLETLIEPFVQDQYAWCDEMAVIIVGTILTVIGILFMSMFFLSAKLSRLYDERSILIWLGFVAALVGIVLLQPWGSTKLIYCNKTINGVIPGPLSKHSINCINYKLTGNSFISSTNHSEDNKLFVQFCPNVTTCLGCPHQQEWCKDIPQLPLLQYLLALFFLMSSFPFGMAMTSTLVSKMLGPKPQGTWMGLLTASGSLARMLGPIFVFYIYVDYGTRYVSFMLLLGTTLAIIVLKIQYHRFLPMSVECSPQITRY